MKNFKLIIHILLNSKLFKYAYYLILRCIFRGKKIIFVNGMRRSGNHAFIEWLVNSIENQKTNLITCNKYRNFNVTTSGKTIFLNEVNNMTTALFNHMIKEKVKFIRECETLIISVEDCYADYSSYKIPRYDNAIYIKRSVLNLVASRLKFVISKAEKGKSNYWHVLDTTILEKVLSFNESEYKVWEFEKWLLSDEYKTKFLSDFGLEFSHLPNISKFGGGSSFTGINKLPDYQKLTKRYLQIQFSKEIISYFRDEKYQGLLSEEELSFIKNNFLKKR